MRCVFKGLVPSVYTHTYEINLATYEFVDENNED